MNESVNTIRGEIRGLAKDLQEAGEKLNQLYGYASQVGRGVEKEMAWAVKGIRDLKLSITNVNAEMAKQRAIITGTTEKLTKAGISVKRYASTSNTLKQEIDKLTGSQRRGIRVLREEANRFGEAKARLQELQTAKQHHIATVATLKTRVQQLNDAYGRQDNQQRRAQKSMLSLSKMARSMAGAFGYGLGLYGVIRLLRETTAIISDFEKTQRQLQAVTNATTGEMARMSAQAIAVGSSTRFGASSIAQMQTQLAKMGFTVREVSNMTEGVSNLAIATQEDLGKTAETLANILRSYNLTSMETARVTDVMAASFVTSALDIERFRQSVKYVAPIANQANLSIEDTTAMLGKLADAGIYGSLAGTSLRNILSQLADSNSNLSKKINFSVRNFDDFIRAMRTLNEQGTDLEDVFKIMDRRASSAFTILLKNVDALELYQASLKKAQGEAARMARVQENSITYQTEKATAAWQGFILALDKGESVYSTIVKGVLSSFSLAMNEITNSLNKESKAIDTELANIKRLIAVSTEEYATIEQRAEALKTLQKEYPEYFENMKDEITTIEDINEALKYNGKEMRALLDVMEQQHKLEVRSESLDALIRKIDTARTAWIDFEGTVTQRGIGISRGMSREEYEQVLDGQIEKMQELREEYEKMMWTDTSISTKALMNHFTAQDRWKDAVEETLKEYNNLTGTIEDLGELDSAHESIVQRLTEERKVYEQLAEGVAENSEEHKKYTDQIMSLEEQLLALGEKHSDARGRLYDVGKKNEESFKRQLEIAELELKLKYEGLALEEKLAKIRLYYNNLIAETKGGDEEEQMKQVANLQYMISMQGIMAGKIKERQELYAKEAKHVDELISLHEQLVQERGRGVLMDYDEQEVTQRYAKEIELAEAAYKAQLAASIKAEDDKLVALEAAKDSRVAHMTDTGETLKQIEKEYQDEINAANEKGEAERLLITEKYENKRKDLKKKELQEYISMQEDMSDLAMAEYDFRAQLDSTLFYSKFRWEGEIRKYERQNAISRLEEQERILSNQIDLVKAKIEEKKVEGQITTEAERQLRALERELTLIQARIKNPKFEDSYWGDMVEAAKWAYEQVTGAMQNIYQQREDFARRERELYDRRVDETARAIDTEIKLNERGFASNVEMARKEHEEAKRLRREALIEEERAAERTRRVEAIIQTVSLMTSAANLFKKETGKLGAVGVISAIGAIAGMFGAWANVKQRSTAATKLEHGGTFILDGKRHSQGGVQLTDKHEAEAGEMVAVFNRSVTRKNSPKLKSLVASINKGEMPLSTSQNFNVYAGNKDIKAMRRMMEHTESYQGNYRIIKHGNHITRCRLN